MWKPPPIRRVVHGWHFRRRVRGECERGSILLCRSRLTLGPSWPHPRPGRPHGGFATRLVAKTRASSALAAQPSSRRCIRDATLGPGAWCTRRPPPKPSVRRRLLWVYLPCSAPGASVNNPAPDMPAASAPPPPSSLTLDQRSGCAAAMGARTGNQLAKHSSGARDADRADPRHPVPKLVGIGGGVCRRFLRRRVVRYGRRTGVVGVATYVVHGSDACVVKGRRQPGSQRASSRAPARRAAQIPRIDKGGRVVAGASRQGKRRRRDRVAAMVRRTRSVP